MLTKELPAHAVIRPLFFDDVDQFLQIEQACFPPEEQCTREKFMYRIQQCPELSAGVFIREYEHRLQPDNESSFGENSQSKQVLQSERLIGHILATKMASKYVTDESMEIPVSDIYGRPLDPNDPKGHKEDGRTIGIHSVCVDPKFQGKAVGYIMLRDYIQRLTTAHTADRISIISHDRLKPFYAKLSFEDMGPSQCTLGGEPWKNLVLELQEEEDED